MKKWLSICAFLLCQLMLFAQSESDYNPNTPPNPEMPRPKFTLTLNCNPRQGGYVYTESQALVAGTKISLGVYPNENFVFEKWTENGETLSTTAEFYYEMPERDVTLTAVFSYNPTTPPNPQKPKLRHTMTLDAQPWQAGYFNWNSTSVIPEEDYVTVTAYNKNESFQFKAWQLDGKTVSEEPSYSFVMPNHDIRLVALYDYNPMTPKNPGSNYFNVETGELLVNDFEPGRLWSACYEKVGDDWENVKSITVAGRINDGDWSIAREFRNCTLLDLSRTNGMTVVPSWAFEGAESIEQIILPSSIQEIGYNAFYGCNSLQVITCYATVPPTASYDAFYSLPKDQVIVYVPASALGRYKKAEGWVDFPTILPLQGDVSKLQVSLLEGTAAIFKDMYIELYNIDNGQRLRYLITDQETYTFSNLIHNTKYNVYLKDTKGNVLGEINEVIIEETDKEETFTSVTIPRDVTIKVQKPNEEDVTSQVTITWMDANDAYLLRGEKLAAQLENTELHYLVTLPQSLGMEYQLPEKATYVVTSSENTITYTLVPLEKISISGVVTDDRTPKSPLSGAVISVSQTVNGVYSKSFTTKTDNEGCWSIANIYQAETEITASKLNYISQTKEYQTLTESVDAFALEDINGTSITLNLTYTDVHGKNDAYTDSVNVAFTIYDEYGQQVTDLSMQYPKIVLKDKHSAGTTFRIVATSKNQKFKTVEGTAIVDAHDCATVTLPIKQWGGIEASYIHTDNTAVVGILYDQNGKLVQKYDYTGTMLSVSELPDGQYTLVTMAYSQFFNNIFSVSQFSNLGIRAGQDYIKNTVAVESGKISKISNQLIPYLNEAKLYFTGNRTSFSVNKTEVNAGQYLTLSSFIDFKSAYASGVSDVKLIVDLPQSASFVNGSVMIGNNIADYTYSNGTIIIPLDNLSERIRLCIVPTAGGNYSPAASVQFIFDEKTITQPIGSVNYTVKNLTLNVPAVVASTTIPVSGSAIGKSKVKVYVDNMLMGQTTALANGSWATTVELSAPENLSTHEVFAVITTTDDMEMLSETQIVTYDETAVEVDNVTMYYTNPEENWWRGKNYELVHNFRNPSIKAHRYVYYIYNRSFTFSVKFTSNPESLTKVNLEVKTGDGRWHSLTAKYDANREYWVAYGEFGNMYDGIVPVNVRVRYIFGGKELVAIYQGPDADVPIDPSGYVYEAVPSNRLQGVTATIFYKETVEDQWGDKHDEIILWDAEEYSQQNPLFTDENGLYRWDVPQGLWQVKFEKEGYQTTYSEWLPVPPPQLDVNIPMTQSVQPKVKRAAAFDRGIEIEFDKFMDPASLNADNILVTRNTNPVYGNVELLNKESVGEGQAQSYASKVKFTIDDDEDDLLSTEVIELTVTGRVKSYAGVSVEEFNQKFTVEPKVSEIKLNESIINVATGKTCEVQVAVQPKEASMNKKIAVRSLSPMVAVVNVVDSLQLDENGEAVFEVTGDMPGTSVLSFTMANTDVNAHMTVNVKEAELLKTVKPRASRVTGAAVYRNTKIMLTSETENAEIYYTLDDSEPTKENATKFSEDAPIEINDDEVSIKAIAYANQMTESDVAEFNYSLKKTTVGYDLPNGWTWISHNLEESVPVSDLKADFDRILSQTHELVKDPVAGLIGNLEVLNPAETYKVKVSGGTSGNLKGYEFDASSTTVHVESGWNWIGYPVSQVMSVAEALEFYEASEGDMIVGRDGFAEFADGEWQSTTLDVLAPGKGYMFKAAHSDEIAFNTTKISYAASRMGQRDYLINSPWAPAKNSYPDVMPVTARLVENGMTIDADDYVVGAFCGTECRGVGMCKNGRLMITVYGQSGDDICFVAKSKTADNYYDITEQIAFASDNKGSWNAPYMLTIGGQATSVETLKNQLTVSPLVFDDYISVSAEGRHISNLTLTNMGGQTVVSLSDLGKGATITTGQLPEGMYIVTVQAEGQSYYKKVLKANK